MAGGLEGEGRLLGGDDGSDLELVAVGAGGVALFDALAAEKHGARGGGNGSFDEHFVDGDWGFLCGKVGERLLA